MSAEIKSNRRAGRTARFLLDGHFKFIQNLNVFVEFE